MDTVCPPAAHGGCHNRAGRCDLKEAVAHGESMLEQVPGRK